MPHPISLAGLALLLALPAVAAEPPAKKVHIGFYLQGFNPARGNRDAAMAAMEKRFAALAGVEVVVSEDGGFEPTGFYRAELDFDPAKVDLGDLAKAAAAGGARARAMLYPAPALDKQTMPLAITAMAKVKGVSDAGCPWGGHVLVLTVKPGGGAKLDAVLTALKAAGAPAETTR